MAANNYKFIMIILSFATSSAAPKQGREGIVQIPEECKRQAFCSVKPEGYDQIEQKMISVLPDFLSNEYSDRDGFDEPKEELSPKSDWHNCPKRTKREQMYLYIHGDNLSKTEIIVQTKTFKQFVETVTCAKEHIERNSTEQCFGDFGLHKFNIMTSCVESLAKRVLYVYDDEKTKIIKKYFDVPACCSCKASYNT